MNVKDLKIISGGQTGADLAGLWASRIFGVPTGGMAPKGWQTQLGSKPQLEELFGLKESESSYHEKTLQNCEQSDLTLIFASNIKSPGTKLTIHHCICNRIHYRVCSFSNNLQDSIENNYPRIRDEVLRQLERSGRAVINVAGNSTMTSTKAFTYTFMMLCRLLKELTGLNPEILRRYGVDKVEEMLRDCYDMSISDNILNIVKSNN